MPESYPKHALESTLVGSFPDCPSTDIYESHSSEIEWLLKYEMPDGNTNHSMMKWSELRGSSRDDQKETVFCWLHYICFLDDSKFLLFELCRMKRQYDELFDSILKKTNRLSMWFSRFSRSSKSSARKSWSQRNQLFRI